MPLKTSRAVIQSSAIRTFFPLRGGAARNPARTWICPINGAHRFTGTNQEFLDYLDHFEQQHQVAVVVLRAPTDVPIQRDRSGVYFIDVNLQAAFAPLVGGPPPFIHVSRVAGQFDWIRRAAGLANFRLDFIGGGSDKIVNPDRLRYFNGGQGGGGTETFSNFSETPGAEKDPQIIANFVNVDYTLINIRLGAYPLNVKGGPNIDDQLTGAEFNIRGYF